MSIVDKYENMLLLLGVKRLSSPAQILKIIAEIKELSNFFGRVKTDDLNTIEASTPDELLEIKGGTDLSTRITDGKLYLDLSTAILGQLEYRGSWDASSGVYPSTPAPEKGWYFVISIAGTISGIEYEISDWIVYNGTSWDRLSGNLLENETSPKLGVNLNANSKKITGLANGTVGTDAMAFGQKYVLESHNKDKHTDIDQSLKTTDDISFNKITLTAGGVIVGTIQLTNAEWTQLANIGVITISAGQWGYLGALDQALAQANTPTFGGLTLNGNLVMGANNITFTTGLVDGVDISALLLKTTKIGDLGAIWTKATKIGNTELDLSALAQNIAFSGAQTVDGIDISAIKLNSMPSVADGDIPVNAQKITGLANGVVASDGMALGQRYTNGEAVSSMGAKGDGNPLHHDKYTDVNARASINSIFGSDGKADKTIDLDGNDLDNIKDIDGNIFFCSSEAEINSAISTIGANGGTIILSSGTFNLTAPITINIAGSIIIKGMGDKTIIDCNGERSAFIITGCASCVLRDFKIDAQDLTTLTKEVIDITEASNNKVIIDNITIVGDGTNGYGIELNSKNCIVQNCKIVDLNIGIYINSNDSIIDCCYITGCNTVAVDFLGSHNRLIKTTMTNNNGSMVIYVRDGANYTIIQNNLIIDNEANDESTACAIYVYKADYMIMGNNEVLNNTNIGAGQIFGLWIQDSASDKCIVTSNVILGHDSNLQDNGTGTLLDNNVI